MKLLFSFVFAFAACSFANAQQNGEDVGQQSVPESRKATIDLAWVPGGTSFTAFVQDESDEQDDSSTKIVDGIWRDAVLQANSHGILVDLATDYVRNSRENFIVPYLKYDSSLAAKDGNYLAQDSAELQTYYDLGLEYEYIQSDAIRSHLGLRTDEGLVIAKVNEQGEGKKYFQDGDLVLRVNETPVDTQYDFVILVKENRGHEVDAVVRRNGEEETVRLMLEPVVTESAGRWILGVHMEDMTDLLRSHLNSEGVVVTELIADSPAEKMGVQINDVIVSVDGTTVASTVELSDVVQATEGKSVMVELIRSGKKVSIEITPKRVDSSQEAAQTPSEVWVDLAVMRDYGPVVIDAYSQVESASEHESENSSAEASTNEKIDRIFQQLQQLQDELASLRNAIDN